MKRDGSLSMKQGLFVGLTTLDMIYQVNQLPRSNQKLVAQEQTIAAGGPATNAAVTFSYLGRDLGSQAMLLSSIGIHPIAQLIRADLQRWQVKSIDLSPALVNPPPTSSILVEATGDRAVISLNATRSQAAPASIPADILSEVQIVLVDGHQMAVSQAIVEQARAQHIPVVVDGGSWKAGFDRVLAAADFVICSANFLPPQNQEFHQAQSQSLQSQSSQSQSSQSQSIADVFNFLASLGVPHRAVTQGGRPIVYQNQSSSGLVTGEIAVPLIQPIDTLGAGDIFHGAFCHYLLQAIDQESEADSEADNAERFVKALTQAADVAARACRSFGTREWMEEQNNYA